MPVQINQENGGKVLAVEARGTLTRADYEKFVHEFERVLQENGKPRVLFDMTQFRGWDPAALWEDVKFDVKHFSDADRFAMVGEQKWQAALTAFSKPFTKAEVRYFTRAEIGEARRWLDQG